MSRTDARVPSMSHVSVYFHSYNLRNLEQDLLNRPLETPNSKNRTRARKRPQNLTVVRGLFKRSCPVENFLE